MNPSSGSDLFTLQPYDGRVFLIDSFLNDVNRPLQYTVSRSVLALFMLAYFAHFFVRIFYLRRFSKSRSSSGSTPFVCLSVRPSIRPSVRPSICPSVRNTLGYQVCVICNSKTLHSFLFKLCLMIIHILKMCTFYFVHVS